MGAIATKKQIQAYYKDAEPSLFLSGMFKTRPELFYKTEKVEIDIHRNDEEVAVAVTDLNAGYRDDEDSQYVVKEFTPPVFKERFPVKIANALKKAFGASLYDDPNFQADATRQIFRGLRRKEKKIRRSIELQASQILRTGTVTLSDATGKQVYTIDYKMKPTHKVTAAVDWDGVSPTIVNDVISTCDVVRDDGLEDPDLMLVPQEDWEVMIKDAGFAARYEGRRMELGRIVSMTEYGAGGKYRGTFDAGNYKLDIVTYNGRYLDPETNTKLRYLPAGQVVIRNSKARMDASFGACPSFLPTDARIMKYLPSRMASVGAKMDMFTKAWASPDGDTLWAAVRSRPLLIPVDIDSFACISTGVS